MIINISDDYYIVDEDEFFETQRKTDSAGLYDWIERNGQFIDGKHFLILERDEVEALMDELVSVYIPKDKPLYIRALKLMGDFLERGKNVRKNKND